MSTIYIKESQVIAAQPDAIYAVLSDYRVGHPAILPRPYFTSLVVEEGGQGEGTRIRVEMNVMGTKNIFHMVVTEPKPGQVLMETDIERGTVTTFTVDPIADGQHSRVTIATNFQLSPGVRGFMERLMNPFITPRIYKQELQQLDHYVRSKAPSTAGV